MWSPLGAHLRNSPVDLLSAAGVPHPERMANRPARSLKHEYGLFVALSENGITGFIPVRNLQGDFFIFDKRHHRFRGQRSKHIFAIGQPMAKICLLRWPRKR